MTHPWWRPTDYNEDMILKIDEYLDEYQDELYDYQKSEWSSLNGSSSSQEEKIKVKLPTIEWFAKYIGVSRSTIYERAWEHEEFSDTLNKILIEQKQRLIEKWLSWHYNSTIAKLVLSANHWMKETTVQENTWKDWWPIDNKVTVEIITSWHNNQ